mmetsp:Transcript_36989/g.87878  ORF Transcript_36989/g.87878 Transcript_36989/m.87878 type:complete len:820 (+) Transcript_36989:389-2848(+)
MAWTRSNTILVLLNLRIVSGLASPWSKGSGAEPFVSGPEAAGGPYARRGLRDGELLLRGKLRSTGALAGCVVHYEALAGANYKLDEGEALVTTDGDGSFVLALPREGLKPGRLVATGAAGCTDAATGLPLTLPLTALVGEAALTGGEVTVSPLSSLGQHLPADIFQDLVAEAMRITRGGFGPDDLAAPNSTASIVANTAVHAVAAMAAANYGLLGSAEGQLAFWAAARPFAGLADGREGFELATRNGVLEILDQLGSRLSETDSGRRRLLAPGFASTEVADRIARGTDLFLNVSLRGGDVTEALAASEKFAQAAMGAERGWVADISALSAGGEADFSADTEARIQELRRALSGGEAPTPISTVSIGMLLSAEATTAPSSTPSATVTPSATTTAVPTAPPKLTGTPLPSATDSTPSPSPSTSPGEGPTTSGVTENATEGAATPTPLTTPTAEPPPTASATPTPSPGATDGDAPTTVQALGTASPSATPGPTGEDTAWRTTEAPATEPPEGTTTPGEATPTTAAAVPSTTPGGTPTPAGSGGTPTPTEGGGRPLSTATPAPPAEPTSAAPSSVPTPTQAETGTPTGAADPSNAGSPSPTSNRTPPPSPETHVPAEATAPPNTSPPAQHTAAPTDPPSPTSPTPSAPEPAPTSAPPVDSAPGASLPSTALPEAETPPQTLSAGPSPSPEGAQSGGFSPAKDTLAKEADTAPAPAPAVSWSFILAVAVPAAVLISVCAAGGAILYRRRGMLFSNKGSFEPQGASRLEEVDEAERGDGKPMEIDMARRYHPVRRGNGGATSNPVFSPRLLGSDNSASSAEGDLA